MADPVPVTTPSAATASASRASLVGDLLAAPSEGTDPLQGAARILRASGPSGNFQATMNLDPPELGQLKLQVRMQQQGMTLHVETQTRQVARLIESRMSELRGALAGHGVNVERADVVVRAPDAGEADLQQRDHHHPAPGDDGRNTHERHAEDLSGRRGRLPGDDQAEDKGRSDLDEEERSTGESDAGENVIDSVPTTELSVDLVA